MYCTDRVSDDPFFFYQLLFPLSPPGSSGIEDDSRMPYFSHVAILTNVYASISGGGSGMGHECRNVTVPELVHWTGFSTQHGASDGKAVPSLHVGMLMTLATTASLLKA
jgi:hypothetical protein